MFSIDACIIATGFVTFGAANAMYAIIAEFITSRVLDMMLEDSYSLNLFLLFLREQMR